MRIGFIGAGKMAETILAALLEQRQKPENIRAGEVRAARRRQLTRRYGIRVTARNRVVVDHAQVLFLCVKPQELAAALAPIADGITGRHLVLSIAAGKTLSTLEQLLPRARVIRVMPNLAASVGAGMSAYCAGSRARPADRRKAAGLLAAFGRAIELPESAFDAVTALSGSGPAFFAYALDALVGGAVKQGLRREDALALAEQTMLGTARVLQEQGVAPADLIASVASPKGTTAEGLAVLDGSDVKDVLEQVIAAAARRSRELRE